MAFDMEIRDDIAKGFIIVFILATFATNLVLLVRYIVVPGFLKLPNACLRLSTSLGSIFLALFSYVVNARFEFEKPFIDLSCHTTLTAYIYNLYFLPFVFGCSLIVQGLYLQFGHHLPSTLNPMLKSLVMVSIPWLLGLVIVCPLTMAGIDWEHGCRLVLSMEYNRAVVIATIVFPSSLAVLVSIVLPCLNKSMGPQYSNLYQVPNQIQTCPQAAIAPQNATEADSQHPKEQYPMTPMTMEQASSPAAVTSMDLHLEMRRLLLSSLVLLFSITPLVSLFMVYFNHSGDLIGAIPFIIIFDVCTYMYSIFPLIIPLFHLQRPKF